LLIDLSALDDGRTQRLERMDDRRNMRGIRPARLRGNDLDSYGGVSQQRAHCAGERDPPHDEHPLGQMPRQPLTGGEQQGAMRNQGAAVVGTERLSDNRPPRGRNQLHHLDGHGRVG